MCRPAAEPLAFIIMTNASTRATAAKNSAGISSPRSQFLYSARASGTSITIGMR